MQTVNFNCSFCNKLMAVGLNLQGRNVRCPHCKQVVQAPATGSVPPPTQPPSAPSFQLPPLRTEGHESIFGEAPSDDLFSAPSQPPPTLPDQPAPRRISDTALNDPFRSSPPLPSSRGGDAPTIDLQSSPQAGHEPWPEQRAAAAPSTDVLPEPLPEEEEPAEEEAPRPVRRPAARESGGGGGVFVWMLLLYALVATGVAAYLFYDKTQRGAGSTSQSGGKDHPYMNIPDFFGQYDRADRHKVVKIDGIAANLTVPEQMRTKLAEPLTVGDLQIVPLRVEYRPVTRYRKLAGQPPFVKPLGQPLCVLYLKIKNNSDDVYFCPTDPAFDRKQLSTPDVMTYSGLVVGDKADERRFLPGGAFSWPDKDFEYEYIEGQQDDATPLGPKEERVYVITADMNNIGVKDLLNEARNKKMPIMWRVQLRRGLDKVKDISGNEREISVSSVIGVVLDGADFPF